VAADVVIVAVAFGACQELPAGLLRGKVVNQPVPDRTVAGPTDRRLTATSGQPWCRAQGRTREAGAGDRRRASGDTSRL
jgi:hypothetical protein